MRPADPAIEEAPSTALLFEPVADAYGLRLALVFGNEHRGGVCPFYASQCLHCDIGAGEGRRLDPAANRRRLDLFLRHYAAVLPRVVHLVLYNSGSTLNRREMSRQTLAAILACAAGLPRCAVLSFDSREMYVTEESLRFLCERTRPDQQLRPILGLESQSDAVRLRTLRKRMTRRGIEAAFAALAVHRGRVGMDVNVVFQPPGLTDEAAVAEAVRTVEYGLDLGERHGVPVDFNLHPYYPSRRGRAAFPDHPRADPEETLRALTALRRQIDRRGSAARLFVGWQDELHDQQPARRQRELARYKARFERFNRSQQVGVRRAARNGDRSSGSARPRRG